MLPGEAPFRLEATLSPSNAPGRVKRDPLPLLYRLLRSVSRVVLRTAFDLRVEGAERLPATGPFILAANHHNYLDGVVLGVAVPRQITFLVMPRVYHASPFHPTFFRHVGSIPINLEKPDPGAIRGALRVLEGGDVVGIFPEGPFSLEGRLVEGQPGVALIALRAGVPVVPAAIHGTYEALHGRVWRIPRPYPLTVRFGEPLSFARVRRETRIQRGLREEVTRRIMAEISGLLSDTGPTLRATRA